MKYIIRKAFWDYEKEEKWLNEMSAKGMSLTDYSWCRYVFEETTKNQYIYRIELLENMPTHPESLAYIRFLEENGIECVTTYMRWIYLRKKASEGLFDLYTDIDSKIAYYKRICIFWNTFIILGFITGIYNLLIGIIYFNNKLENFSNVNLVLGFLPLLISLLFVKLALPIRNKIRKLKQEKSIRE